VLIASYERITKYPSVAENSGAAERNAVHLMQNAINRTTAELAAVVAAEIVLGYASSVHVRDVVYTPAADLVALARATAEGAPEMAFTPAYVAEAADDDADGFANASEFALGTNPRSAASRPLLSADLQSFPSPQGPGLPDLTEQFLTISFARDPRSDNLITLPEASTDLVSWSLSTMTRVLVVPNPDGFQSELWRSTTPVSSRTSSFLRLRVTVP
jgi:hypothetical protein